MSAEHYGILRMSLLSQSVFERNWNDQNGLTLLDGDRCSIEILAVSSAHKGLIIIRKKSRRLAGTGVMAPLVRYKTLSSPC